MTADTARDIGSIITGEGLPPIVTLQAVIPGRSVVLTDGDKRDLPSLRSALYQGVTLVTTY